ncbi:carboxypeptidase S [Mycena metata]|uniref:Carboxypeptidase S n=1 Tax=Mycena metata TaxID=1033252 RepID=A0AAD7K7H5_9AGAR|nr:carboxypeptidase S [Mycena metata]
MDKGCKTQAGLLAPVGVQPTGVRRVRWPTLVAGVAFLALLHLLVSPSIRPIYHSPVPLGSSALICPQETSLAPEKSGELWNDLTALHATNDFLMRAVGQLSAAVQIPSESFDEMGPIGEDERWLSRAPFVDHLATAFPLVHTSLELQKVNTYGLMYIWQGSDASLKPLLLMSHYDVVPVPPSSADQWTHPAYSGYFDGKNIWGRGSWDDKAGIISKLLTIEVLLEKKFVPTRTVVLSFGFDEEASGAQGAGHLAPALLKRFGPDSFAMILDEGGGTAEQFGGLFALPSIAEKGFANVKIEVQTPGGHSSVPPEHTSIGMLAALIVHFENNAPVASLEVDTPIFETLQCWAAHAPDIPGLLKRAILSARTSPVALKAVEAILLKDPIFKSIVGTTQAVDVVSGGVKSNALPEQAQALVNHRIATKSSVNATLTRDAELTRDLAARFNLSVTAFGELLTPAGAASFGSLSLTTIDTLEPAPISPSDAPAYRLLAGTIRATFHAVHKDEEKEIFVAPTLMAGNTDTRFYWSLSQHIFRYDHSSIVGEGIGEVHTVDEHFRAAVLVEMITFFTTLVLNADEAAL